MFFSRLQMKTVPHLEYLFCYVRDLFLCTLSDLSDWGRFPAWRGSSCCKKVVHSMSGWIVCAELFEFGHLGWMFFLLWTGQRSEALFDLLVTAGQVVPTDIICLALSKRHKCFYHHAEHSGLSEEQFITDHKCFHSTVSPDRFAAYQVWKKFVTTLKVPIH